MTGVSPERPKPVGRITLLDTPRVTAFEPLTPPPPPLPSSPPLHAASTPSRPAFAPNPAIPFLQRVHARSNAAGLERLVAIFGRSLAWVGLGAGVAAAIASAFVFSSSPSSLARSSTSQNTRALPAPPAASDTIEPVRNLSDAINALESFLTTPSARTRGELSESPGSLPELLAREGTIPAFAAINIDQAKADLRHYAEIAVAFVPITDAHGLPRTAAVVHKGDQWRIDWRSVLTPEDRDWDEFVSGRTRGISQFRVHVSRQPDGSWTVGRPASRHNRVTVSVISGSRVAEELGAALDARGGAPLSADVFLESGPGSPLTIVDWTRDKWSL